MADIISFEAVSKAVSEKAAEERRMTHSGSAEIIILPAVRIERMDGWQEDGMPVIPGRDRA